MKLKTLTTTSQLLKLSKMLALRTWVWSTKTDKSARSHRPLTRDWAVKWSARKLASFSTMKWTISQLQIWPISLAFLQVLQILSNPGRDHWVPWHRSSSRGKMAKLSLQVVPVGGLESRLQRLWWLLLFWCRIILSIKQSKCHVSIINSRLIFCVMVNTLLYLVLIGII